VKLGIVDSLTTWSKPTRNQWPILEGRHTHRPTGWLMAALTDKERTVLRGDIQVVAWDSSRGTVACVVGIIDDLVDIKPWQKIIGQVIASLFIVASE